VVRSAIHEMFLRLTERIRCYWCEEILIVNEIVPAVFLKVCVRDFVLQTQSRPRRQLVQAV
jgi:hypothetical protein